MEETTEGEATPSTNVRHCILEFSETNFAGGSRPRGWPEHFVAIRDSTETKPVILEIHDDRERQAVWQQALAEFNKRLETLIDQGWRYVQYIPSQGFTRGWPLGQHLLVRELPTRWEHLSVTYWWYNGEPFTRLGNGSKQARSPDEVLNELGLEGWKVAAAFTDDKHDLSVLWLKRRVSS